MRPSSSPTCFYPSSRWGLPSNSSRAKDPQSAIPVRSSRDIDDLETQNGQDLGYVGEAIAKVKKALDGRIPTIGFAGAPFTLASYMIEGGSSRNFALTKSLMYSDPAGWERLMAKILEVLVPYAANQVACGSRRHSNFRQLGRCAGAGRLQAVCTAALPDADPADSDDRSAGHSFRHRRGNVPAFVARGGRRRAGDRLARQTR